MNRNKFTGKKNTTKKAKHYFDFKGFFTGCPYTVVLLVFLAAFWIYRFNFGDLSERSNDTQNTGADFEVAEAGDNGLGEGKEENPDSEYNGTSAGDAFNADSANENSSNENLTEPADENTSDDAEGTGNGDSNSETETSGGGDDYNNNSAVGEGTDSGEKADSDNPEDSGVTSKDDDFGETDHSSGDADATDHKDQDFDDSDSSASDGDDSTGGSAGSEDDGNEEESRRWKAQPQYYGKIVDGYYYYEPRETDSRYYYDVGRIAYTTEADYESVSDDYFDDACWVGDSRSVGIYDYCGWSGTDFYCDNGYCIYDYKNGGKVTNQKTGKKYTLEEALKLKQYKKIYIMLGINDAGYGTTESFQDSYRDMLDMIYVQQPDAVIYLVANLRISESAESGVYTNININSKNVAISELADGVRSFYLDYNDMFVDGDGYLISDYTFDGFHLYAKQYQRWADYFREHAIVNLEN